MNNFNEAFRILKSKKKLTTAKVEEALKLLSGCMSVGQVDEVIKGIENGVNIEDVENYARRGLSPDVMRQARIAYEKGLSSEQVLVCISDKFDDGQLDEIICGFLNGLGVDEVKVYANNEFSWSEMYEMRDGFERGLNIEEVQGYAKRGMGWMAMQDVKKVLLEVKRSKNK